MALQNCNDIVGIANQIAKTPNFTSQAQGYLNAILNDLAETYDFDLMKVENYTITTGAAMNLNGLTAYPLPANFLRSASDELLYYVSGQPFILNQVPLWKIKQQFTGQGSTSYPYTYATDFSTVKTLGYPVIYFYPSPNGAYNINVPYFMAHQDITDFTTIPWFPNRDYLLTKLASRMMMISDDTRQKQFNEDAEAILEKYLKMKDDPEGYAKTVKLDRQNFRYAGGLKNTKALPI